LLNKPGVAPKNLKAAAADLGFYPIWCNLVAIRCRALLTEGTPVQDHQTTAGLQCPPRMIDHQSGVSKLVIGVRNQYGIGPLSG
jgi:hypothetical protein